MKNNDNDEEEDHYDGDDENDDDGAVDHDNILLKRRARTTLYPRLLIAYLEVEKQERGAQKTTTPTISTSEYSWDEQLRS